MKKIVMLEIKKLMSVVLVLFFVVACGFGTDDYSGEWNSGSLRNPASMKKFVIEKNGNGYLVHIYVLKKNYNTNKMQMYTDDYSAVLKNDRLILEAGKYGMPRVMTYIEKDKTLLFNGKKYYRKHK